MNILYIDHYAGSLSMGMEFRPYYFAREWQKLGHRVRIVGASFSHLRKVNPEVSKDFEIQTIDGVEFQWIRTGRYKGNGAARALTLFEFCAKLYVNAGRLAKEFQPDVIISSSTYPLDTYAAQRIKKLSKSKPCYIHEAHDLWPLTLIELAGWREKHPFIRMLATAENSAFSRSDAIVGVTAGEAEYMLTHGMQSRDKFTHIPNGIVLEDWDQPEPLGEAHATLLARLKAENKFLVCYLGGHALSNALDTLLDAAKLMRGDERFAFVMVGGGVEKPRLQKRAEDEHIDNLFFLPPVGKKQVPSLLAQMDALYVGAERCSLYRFGVSMNKVYDYMMAAKPIIYGVEAANNDVAEAGCGITIEPGSASGIRDAALSLIGMSEDERAAMGELGRRWVLENCEYGRLAEQFLTVLAPEKHVTQDG